MADPLPLTPRALESLLADASHETFVSFVADLLAREGREVDRDGSVIRARRAGDGGERLLVWTDERGRMGRLVGSDPSPSGTGGIDAVVARDRDATGAAAIAAPHEARVIGTGELHDRLLYAIDREACLELCRTHFDTVVEPRPADEPGRERTPLATVLRPRVLLTAAALLGIVVAGAMGLPATPDGDGFDAGGGVGSPVPGGTGAVTPVGGGAPTRKRPTETTAATPGAEESGVVRCRDCLSLLSFPELRVEAGSREIVTSTLHNPYPGNITGIDVRLVQPSNEVDVDPARGQAIDVLEPNESRAIAWGISATDSARGTYEVIVVMRFRQGNLTTYGEDVVRVTVTEPTPAIPADCDGQCDVLAADRTVRVAAGEAATITATLRNPYEATLTDVEVIAEPHGNWAVTPANATGFDTLLPGASRDLKWNLTVPESAAGEYSFVVRATFAGPAGDTRRTVRFDYSVYVEPPASESDGSSG